MWQVLYAFWVSALSSCLQRPRSKPPDSTSGCFPGVGEDLEPGSSYTLLSCLNTVVLVMGLKGAQPDFMNDFRFFPACSLISSTGSASEDEGYGVIWDLVVFAFSNYHTHSSWLTGGVGFAEHL